MKQNMQFHKEIRERVFWQNAHPKLHREKDRDREHFEFKVR